VFSFVGAGEPARAQTPAPAHIQQLLQQPGVADAIRARIRESGLTAEQIRARLRASGYPEGLLDAYLGAARDGAAPGPAELGALEALGLRPVGLGDWARADTGLVRTRADPLAPPSRVFGVDVFRRNATLFLPLLSGPVPPDYRLGPGDVLVVILTGDVERSYQLPVTREGFILVPQVGQVHVANLTLDELRRVLYDRVRRVYASVRGGASATTRLDISVANVRANQVYVAGEVAQPGAYQISSLGTVLTALYAAGGVTERANLRQLEVRRLGKVVARLDLYDYLLHGDTRSDVRLETGDVVFVPLHGTRVQVSGAVIRPGIYELKPGETLEQLIHAAGGFRADAALRRLAVHRVLPPGERGPGPAPRAVLDVPLPAEPAGASAASSARPAGTASGVRLPVLALMDSDSVVVDSLPPLDETHYVAIAGRVTKPGRYPWRPGMTLRDLVLLARGPRVGAYLKEAEIARLPEDRSRGQLATTMRVPLDSTYLLERGPDGRYVGPPGAPIPAAGAPDVPLHPYDNVLIMEEPEFDFQRSVVVAGQVRYPGTYSLRSKEERLADVIQRAGGLTSQAYALGIRFVRAADNVGRINIDLPRALRDARSSHNVILQPGDSIFVPEYQPSVKVVGAVNAPGSVLWRRGAGLAYYINAAGGLAAHADPGRSSVRFANGEARTQKRWLIFTSAPVPGPGSEVFVPAKPAGERTNVIALMGGIAQVLSAVVAIIVVLNAN
jgi:protein involved in polysaccharide export with SLBB domain